MDWGLPGFRSRVTDRVLFGNNVSRELCLYHGGRVEDFFHTTRRLELVLDWPGRHHYLERTQDRLFFWIVPIGLLQSRTDVFRSHQVRYPGGG